MADFLNTQAMSLDVAKSSSRQKNMKSFAVFFLSALVTHVELTIAHLNKNQNILVNEFTENSLPAQGWSRKHRTSYWAVTGVDDEFYNTEDGEVCLCFEPTKEQSYFSQFLSFKSDGVISNQGLLLHATLKGQGSAKIKIKLYIRYTNGLLFKVTSEENGGVINTFIPKYGTIKTIAVYVILETKTEATNCICGVTLKFSPSAVHPIPVYVNTFPIQRRVIPFFLSPGDSTGMSDFNAITVATQLTFDRLSNLERLAKRWKGPVSAAVLVMGHQKEYVSEIVKFYSNTEVLSRYVTMHLVHEDIFNGKDNALYPVNFLRNIALDYITSKQVFLLDVDIIPGFTMTEADQWIKAAGTELCTKCAFVAPLYQADHSLETLPTNKSQLLDFLQHPDIPISAVMTASHGMVNFNKWETTSQPYQIQYREDMEPYFITDAKAPLLNDVYDGYGRDKCAYSRDLEHTGYQFVVLPKAFAVDIKNSNRGTNPTIYDRSKGVQLNMFLSIDFHAWELKQNHLTYRKYKRLGYYANIEDTCEKHADTDESEFQNHWTVTLHEDKAHQPGAADQMFNESTVSKDHDAAQPLSCQTLVPENVLHSELPSLDGLEHEKRDDVIVERLIRRYQTGHVIIMPHVHRTGSGLLTYLHFVHPDSVTVLSPTSGPFQSQQKGQYEELSGTGNLSTLLSFSRNKNQGASLILLFTLTLTQDEIPLYLTSAIATMTTKDILVISGESKTLMDLLKISPFCNSTSMEVFRLKIGILLKSKKLSTKDSPAIPEPPQLNMQLCSSVSNLKTDVILMTRNRPLQTLAFLQSLSVMATGISKVWVQYRADDEVFRSGYKNAVNCVKHTFNIELVDDKNDGFGKTLKRILQTSSAEFMIFAVDEMVWLRPVNLKLAACLMYHQKDIASFQLRLGENIGVFKLITNRNMRIFPIQDRQDISLYYPLRMPYDFGYVLNVDGTMMNISMLLEDMQDWLELTNHPGELESRWMVRRIHTRARQWHLMYRESRLVNNALDTDGRVIGKTYPVDGSYQLANLMLENKKQISISDFIIANAMHSSTHITQDVVYEDLTCKT